MVPGVLVNRLRQSKERMEAERTKIVLKNHFRDEFKRPKLSYGGKRQTYGVDHAPERVRHASAYCAIMIVCVCLHSVVIVNESFSRRRNQTKTK